MSTEERRTNTETDDVPSTSLDGNSSFRLGNHETTEERKTQNETEVDVASTLNGNNLLGTEERIQEKLMMRFEKIELPEITWTNKIISLEELCFSLKVVKTIGDCEERKEQEMPLEELFNVTDGRQPVRILIEGGPCQGKTTFCLKLLYDWGRKKAYIFFKFRFVFLFTLQYFKQNYSVDDMLKEEIQKMGFNEDEGMKCIKEFESKTLLLLDGFDEMSDECKKELLPLLYKSEYPLMSIVVTSRKGMFKQEKNMKRGREGNFEIMYKDLNVWQKRVLIEGFPQDRIELFLKKYVQIEYEELENVTNSIKSEIFQSPLFLLLLAMLLQEKTPDYTNSTTTLYSEFFNCIIKRSLKRINLLANEEEVDIINQSSYHFDFIQSLNTLGNFAIEYLSECRLNFEENDFLKLCNGKLILQLGLFIKIPKLHGNDRDILYQPIHKSFLEFVAAFAMWNLFKTDENQFKNDIERIGERGLKPTIHSLFYVFLGGLMNSKAYALFQSLSPYHLWFNIESLCFTKILSEIKDINSFFSSFVPILDSFIPSYYRITGDKGVNKDFFKSDIHSLILKHASDQQLIKVLNWNTFFPVNMNNEVYFEWLKLDLTGDVFQICSEDNKPSIKCKNIICHFSSYFQIHKWDDFVSLFNSIQYEKIHFEFDSEKNNISSLVMDLLHEELIYGQWKDKNIDRIRFHLNSFDDLRSLSLLLDLMAKNKISEGVYLWINNSEKRTKEENYHLKWVAEELFSCAMESKTIKEFIVCNYDYNVSPMLKLNRVQILQLQSLYLFGFVNLFNTVEKKKETHSVEEIKVILHHDKTNMNLIQNIQGIKYFCCKLICFHSLIENNWEGLKEIEELLLGNINPNSIRLLNFFPQLENLQVLSLDLNDIQTISSNSKSALVNLFSSLNLRICEILYIQNLEIFSSITESLMDGLKKKEVDENNSIVGSNSTVGSNEGMKVQLQELVIYFNKIEIDFNQLKNSIGIQSIQTMLRNKQLQQFCWVDINDYHVINLDHLDSLFPSKNKFRIFYELNGMNPFSSRQSQFDYRWFSLFDRFCIKIIDDFSV